MPFVATGFFACDELDAAQAMPVVAKPIPVEDALFGFPSAKASVASLLAEGPRKEPLPSMKVPQQIKGSASPAVPKPGGSKSNAKPSGASVSAAASSSLAWKEPSEETLPQASGMASSSMPFQSSPNNSHPSTSTPCPVVCFPYLS